jgi:23S rRNA (adenine2030-N6)-methyltransferase
MNYRHHFHAGNFADVMKHVLLGQLIHALQRKEKGFLILDTHSGRGIYDLALAETGQTQKRAPEHPAGIGRLLADDHKVGGSEGRAGSMTRPARRSPKGEARPGSDPENAERPTPNAERSNVGGGSTETQNPELRTQNSSAANAERPSTGGSEGRAETVPPPGSVDRGGPTRSALPLRSESLAVERSALSVERSALAQVSSRPPAIIEYLGLVRAFDQSHGNLDGPLRFYPGSPWIARRLMRPQDRLALCELQEDECLALRAAFASEPRTAVHELDGYTGLRAMLPPPEKRALVLIDPPYEAQDEWARVAQGLEEALKRFPSGVYAVWYPLTDRARLDAFAEELLALRPPPTLVAELEIAGPGEGLRMRGCGLVIINPPWQFEQEARPVLEWMARELAQGPGARFTLRWIVPE